jgi:hypothetical protein
VSVVLVVPRRQLRRRVAIPQSQAFDLSVYPQQSAPAGPQSHLLNAFFAFGAMLKDVLGGVFAEDEGDSGQWNAAARGA